MEAGTGNGNGATDAAPQAEDYKPKFDRLSTERRVLGHITDEGHVGRGPRNTAERLAVELHEDPYTEYGGDQQEMQDYLDSLEQAGLILGRGDGTYEVTDDGRTELTN
jgi:hypothetical protein